MDSIKSTGHGIGRFCTPFIEECINCIFLLGNCGVIGWGLGIYFVYPNIPRQELIKSCNIINCLGIIHIIVDRPIGCKTIGIIPAEDERG